MKKLQKQQSGFTIIEVLIVLAIAGLIMLIVFLAVPALQRNSRNTQRRNDVSTYLGAVNEWSNNNQGRIPTANTDLTTANTGVNALAKLGVYTAPTTTTNGNAVQAAITAVDTMRYVYGATCNTNNSGATVPGSSRAYAVQFAVEGSGSSSISQCQDS
jgi:prepilin-type N-terminal cleavage/methylation domain-containing protein